MNMFDNEILSSRMYAASVAVWRLVIITMLVLLFSIPIVTVGAAFASMIATIRQSDYPVFKTFWKNFRENIFRSLPLLFFTIVSISFLEILRQLVRGMPIGGILFLLALIFLIAYNLNAYLLVSILKKCNLTFFRQVFFFTIGTLYKVFFIPIIASLLVIVAPLIGGNMLLIISLGSVVLIYVRMIRTDLETIEEFI